MAKTIDDCLTSVRTTLRSVSGVRSAPDGVVDSSGGIFPFVVAWEGPGRAYREQADTVRHLFSIVVQLHFSRRGLYDAETMATPIAEAIRTALLLDPTLGATCETYGEIACNGFQPLQWGEPASAIQTVGYEFRLTDIKIRQDSAAT